MRSCWTSSTLITKITNQRYRHTPIIIQYYQLNLYLVKQKKKLKKIRKKKNFYIYNHFINIVHVYYLLFEFIFYCCGVNFFLFFFCSFFAETCFFLWVNSLRLSPLNLYYLPLLWIRQFSTQTHLSLSIGMTKKYCG